nr:MAG TPA: hypothetical protein [Caudoviricetes sp.]
MGFIFSPKSYCGFSKTASSFPFDTEEHGLREG